MIMNGEALGQQSQFECISHGAARAVKIELCFDALLMVVERKSEARSIFYGRYGFDKQEGQCAQFDLHLLFDCSSQVHLVIIYLVNKGDSIDRICSNQSILMLCLKHLQKLI